MTGTEAALGLRLRVQLIEAAETLRDKALLETTYATGCRVSEIAGMRVEDVSWTEHTIKVLGKGNKERLVPLNERAIGLLKASLGKRKKGWLFQGQPDRGTVTFDDRATYAGFWIGKYETDYEIEHSGALRFRSRIVRLGKRLEQTREEAKRQLADILAGKLKPRPRPVSETPIDARTIRYNAGWSGVLGTRDIRNDFDPPLVAANVFRLHPCQCARFE